MIVPVRAGAQALALSQNMVAVAQYMRLPVHGQLESLHMLMLYSFYASQCVGCIMLTSKRLTSLLTRRFAAFWSFFSLDCSCCRFSSLRSYSQHARPSFV